jgi:hypothetical protein
LLVFFREVTGDTDTLLIDWLFLEIFILETLAALIEFGAFFAAGNLALSAYKIIVFSVPSFADTFFIHGLLLAIGVNVVAFGASRVVSGVLRRITVQALLFVVANYARQCGRIFVSVVSADAFCLFWVDFSCVDAFGTDAVLLAFGAVRSLGAA